MDRIIRERNAYCMLCFFVSSTGLSTGLLILFKDQELKTAKWSSEEQNPTHKSEVRN